VGIISVISGKKWQPDKFRALVKRKRRSAETSIPLFYTGHCNDNFEHEWLFERQGSWWLLDKVKTRI
jgi:hypothetical protein